MANRNDAILDKYLQAIAGGDRNALAALYHETAASVYAFALSILKNAHDAEDILQESFITIHASAHRYRSSGKPMAWILTISRNLCLMCLREQKKMEALPLADWQQPLDWSQEMAAIDRLVIAECMQKLSDQERQIVVLHAVSGLKHREISQMLSLPLPTVLSKYHRAIKKLKTILEKENGKDDR